MARSVGTAVGKPAPPGFFREGFAPWLEILAHPWEALQWVVIAMALGGVGVWLVPILSPERSDPWYQTVAAGNLAGFCILLLADMIVWEWPLSRRAGKPVDKPRDVAYSIAFLAILLQLGFLIRLAFAETSAQPAVVRVHVAAAIPTLILALYLLCFRLRELEPSVDVVEKHENEDVKELGSRATEINTTSTGEVL